MVGREQHSEAKKAKVVAVRNRVGLNRNRVNNKVQQGVGRKRLANKTAAAKTDAAKKTEVKEKPTAPATTDATAPSTEGKEPAEPKPCKYEGIPVELLACKVCRKSFGDGPVS